MFLHFHAAEEGDSGAQGMLGRQHGPGLGSVTAGGALGGGPSAAAPRMFRMMASEPVPLSGLVLLCETAKVSLEICSGEQGLGVKGQRVWLCRVTRRR